MSERLHAVRTYDDLIMPGDAYQNPKGNWSIVLPNGTIWHSSISAADGSMWALTGESVNDLTVMPSINDLGSDGTYSPAYAPWHGWIRSGQFVTA